VGEYGECCTCLRLSVRGRIPLPSKQLLSMGAVLSCTVAFAVTYIHAVQAIGVDENECVIATVWIRAGFSRRVPQLYSEAYVR